MVKVTYHCEVCRREYTTREDAETCEAKPNILDGDFPPEGTLFVREVINSKDDELFVAVIAGPPKPSFYNKHQWDHPCWWFRGNGCGDDPTKEWGKGRHDVAPDTGTWRKTPPIDLSNKTVLRACAAVRAAGKTPLMVIDGEVTEIPE